MTPNQSRLDSPLLAALVVGICYTVLFVTLLHARGGDVSRFVVAGGENVDAGNVPPGLTVIPNIGGCGGSPLFRRGPRPLSWGSQALLRRPPTAPPPATHHSCTR